MAGRLRPGAASPVCVPRIASLSLSAKWAAFNENKSPDERFFLISYADAAGSEAIDTLEPRTRIERGSALVSPKS